jgi:Flp pilus assembly protein TadG
MKTIIFCGFDRRGSSAVEFALVFPCFLLMLFASVCYGVYIGTLHSVQQLAAEAARASVAGMSATERASIAQNFVSGHLAAYPLLTPDRTTISVTEGTAPDYSFQVSVSFDMVGSVIYAFNGILPLPPALITRSAVVRRGGF